MILIQALILTLIVQISFVFFTHQNLSMHLLNLLINFDIANVVCLSSLFNNIQYQYKQK